MKRWSGPLLIAAVLFGQAALLEHEYDFAAHKTGETCVTCLHATPLSHAAVGMAFLAFPLPVLQTEFQFVLLRKAVGTLSAYRARAPPLVVAA